MSFISVFHVWASNILILLKHCCCCFFFPRLQNQSCQDPGLPTRWPTPALGTPNNQNQLHRFPTSFPTSRPATALEPHSWAVSHSGNQICSSNRWKPLHEAGLAVNLAKAQSCLQLHPQQLGLTQQKFPCSPYRRHLRTWSSDDQRGVCYSLSEDVLYKAISLRMRNITKLSNS